MQRLGKVAEEEMFKVFNMGIGMALIVSPYHANAIQRFLKRHGQKASVIGEVKRGKRGVAVK